ncbi:MAG: hypothetical protein J1E38_03345 [Paramuribaculum sp.]|nr:hypothetical protein [Paramuribaculum sp.]
MYSEELEELIDAILEDGVITEKERAVLHRRALAEGEDPEELDIIIDARLAKMKKKSAAIAAESQPTTDESASQAISFEMPVPPPVPSSEPTARKENAKYGDVRKCPHCGAIVEAGSMRCGDCGYAFVGVEAVSSRQKFSDMLDEIGKREFKSGGLLGLLSIDEDRKRDNAMAQAIINFPVPNSKEDLLEFILFLKPQSKVNVLLSENQETTKAYKRKYAECIEKAKFFFGDDPQVRQLLSQEENKGLFGKLFGRK